MGEWIDKKKALIGNDMDSDGIGNTLRPYNSSGDIQNGGDYLPLTTVSLVDLIICIRGYVA